MVLRVAKFGKLRRYQYEGSGSQAAGGAAASTPEPRPSEVKMFQLRLLGYTGEGLRGDKLNVLLIKVGTLVSKMLLSGAAEVRIASFKWS